MIFRWGLITLWMMSFERWNIWDLRMNFVSNGHIITSWVRAVYTPHFLNSNPTQMYMLASRIITHYTGSYTSFVKDRIFIPLNMSSTTYLPSEAVASGEMTQSWTKQGRRISQWFTDETTELHAGPGGVISSAEDMVCIFTSASIFSCMIKSDFEG